MGSLSPPARLAPPPLASSENSVDGYRVYASFCMREPSASNANISNWIECYNPSDNTWTFVSPIPGLKDNNHVLKGFSMVSIGYSIYIIGGRVCRKERAHVSDEIAELVDFDVDVLSRVLRYDVNINQWFNCTPLGVPRYDFACTICGENKIYVAGGQSTLASARGISSTEVYDPNINTWTTLPYLSRLRYKCVGVTWKGKIHVVGGFAVRGDSYGSGLFLTERSSAEVLDTHSKRWNLMAEMWPLDIPPNQIVAINGKLFSSGDCLNAWKGHIDAYDEELKMWNMVDGSRRRTLCNEQENCPPVQRLYLTMAAIGTYLYFLAGYRIDDESSRTMSMVHRFDTSSNSWKSFEPMEVEGEKELCSHCCVVQLSRGISNVSQSLLGTTSHQVKQTLS